MSHLPYSEIFDDLLIQIHKALGYCYVTYKKRGEILETDKKLASFFQQFQLKYRHSGLNKHLIKGLTSSEQKKQKVFPRLSKITIQAFLQVQESKRKLTYKTEILPSPLYILYHALTLPSEPQTAAYPFILCRSMLFYFLKIHPKYSYLDYVKEKFSHFGEDDLLNSISSFKKYINIQARWPDPRLNPISTTSKVNFLNGHILGLKGIAHLWFTNEQELLGFCNIKVSTADKLDALTKIYSRPKYHFRLSGSYSELPDPSEIINWIFGLPVPIRGADILFQGGLKRTSSSGLVMSIHGQPGTGKTSAALSFSAVLSPLKTTTIYLSLEEETEDLMVRLQTLIPEYLRELSIYEDKPKKKKFNTDTKFDWFNGFKINPNLTIEELTKILKLLKNDLVIKQKEAFDAAAGVHFDIPAVCPLLIVIDNINELFVGRTFESNNYEELERFIEQCRDMGALVILVAADDIPAKIKLDYLVDVSMHLKQIGIDRQSEKTLRILQLIKTRHQVSRQGAHVFHISNSKGFRISPQVPSQMDKREKLRQLLPSADKFIPALNVIQKKRQSSYYHYLPIALQSQILIHGYGSSGKAGLGLKLLLTPYTTYKSIHEWKNKKIFTVNPSQKNKVLIVSFLYPDEYYDLLVLKLKKQLSSLFEGYNPYFSIFTVKSFYPGFLTPEDFVYKIVRLLDEANLEGEPYTGILLDGLHNVFLQFKNLQGSDMIWPLLYSILSRYNLTVVSTFTNFSFNESHVNQEAIDKKILFQSPEDFTLMQQGQKPFLHGLVKAADYYLMLEEIIDDSDDYKKKYWLSVKSSIRQTPPKEFLEWDRQELLITQTISANQAFRMKRSGIS